MYKLKFMKIGDGRVTALGDLWRNYYYMESNDIKQKKSIS